jgi:hypothetical protein
MTIRLSVFALCLLSCDSLFVDNPANCVRRPQICSTEEFCDPVSQSCQSLDCTLNSPLCLSSEYCNTGTRRCTAKDCVVDATLCASDQRCNPSNRSCEAVSFVLGEPDEVSNLSLAHGLNRPEMVRLIPDPLDSSKTKLIVGDSLNRRVLVWNTLPTSNRPADVVFGAPDIHTALAATGAFGGVNESSIGNAWGVSSDGIRLVVGDVSLFRVLIWNTIPSQPPARGPIAASRLWGQSSFLTSSPDAGFADPGPSGLRSAKVFLDRAPSTSFYISDTLNNRVLGFPALPGGPTTNPAFVLGQPDFKTVQTNPVQSGNTLRAPRDVTSDGTLLWVADSGNHRILGFPLAALATNATATSVIGQPDLNSTAPNNGGLASGLAVPNSIGATKTPRLLFVADGGNNRVLRYSPATSLTTPDLVLGQPNLLSNVANRGGLPGLDTLANPAGVDSDGTRLVVGDYNNSRVLLWLTMPTTNGQAADVVLGQPNGQSNLVNNPPSRGPLVFRSPRMSATDGTRLFVTDLANNRVLIWNRMPASGSTPPDLVLGQSDFTGDAPNAGGAVTASSLSAPYGISVEGGRLAVGDSVNNRVLIWNQLPTQNNQPADLCIGQPDCSSAIAATANNRLRGVGGVQLSGGALYVADTGNNRVLLFSNPTTQGAVATRVLGQTSMVSAVANPGGESANTLAGPRSVRVSGGRIFVADTANHRVLIWNRTPMLDGGAADLVVGQADFVSSYTRPDRTLLESPGDMSVVSDHLYVASLGQSRILYWSQIPTTNGVPADRVLGQLEFTTVLANHPGLPGIERLTQPIGLMSFQNRLFVCDGAHNRMVVRGLVE